MNKMQTTAEDLIKLYEAKESTLAVIFNAFAFRRKLMSLETRIILDLLFEILRLKAAFKILWSFLFPKIVS